MNRREQLVKVWADAVDECTRYNDGEGRDDYNEDEFAGQFLTEEEPLLRFEQDIENLYDDLPPFWRTVKLLIEEALDDDKSIECRNCEGEIVIGQTMYVRNGKYFCSKGCALAWVGFEESVLEECYFEEDE